MATYHLADYQKTRYILDRFGITARKKYGQNFLISEPVVYGILDAANIDKEDAVLEIGPGIGTMTGYLSEAAGQVLCIEIDKSLERVLSETLDGCDNTHVFWGDVLKTDLPELFLQYGMKTPVKVAANLPYYITTPILLFLLEHSECFESMTIMVQKEVAERICADPGSKAYGALTLAVSYYAEPECALEVPPESFFPKPGVDSTVLHLKARSAPPVSAPKEALFKVIRASFNQRRKTLVNGLSHGLKQEGWSVSKEQVADAVGQLGLSPTIRGEALTMADFSNLTEILQQCYTI